MFTILPSRDKEILEKCSPETDGAQALIFSEKGQEIGYICVEQRGDILKVIGMELYYCGDIQRLSQKDRGDGDCLVRAAGSYALNRNLMIMESEKEELFPLLTQLGFKRIDNKVRINLRELFMPCKN